jgi:hyperosmotically inducible periplasmic protein
MKFSKGLVAVLACVGVLGVAEVAQAQDASDTTTSPMSDAKAGHKQNLQLEHAVRRALDKQKIDTSDIRVVARSGAVGLEGTVPVVSQVSAAGSVAQGVTGVKTVKNGLTLRQEGH